MVRFTREGKDDLILEKFRNKMKKMSYNTAIKCGEWVIKDIDIAIIHAWDL
jgi:hypothetical protein